MVLIIIQTKKSYKLKIMEIDHHTWQHLRTLLKWMKNNPKIWHLIKNFVYEHGLNKKKKGWFFKK